ncbi:efflux RND transporter periplasmic adaptor subunit [Rariglobus hedericola]|uniref:Efflux RND transporter periplasmic adaptor subunit n=1 Tax=Rariglobus hedericola TaxID=2597822 RepID=A0A556QDI1_9BACT|nr:efflux RND transporter periplasmic adaptor subunit [Rariglobus hedericola]TSJ74719.1 efflux RND transporter periplasmic adaptor subunit [Rariglobus hedericola]
MKNSLRSVAMLATALGGVILLSACGQKKPAAAPRAISVEITEATTRDVPIWLNGIGNVQANNTVTVRPRVSGELESIQFTEGQEIKVGDILAQIDSRPYKAALAQALAQLAQSEAQNANDLREYERIKGLVATNTESRQLLDQREATRAQSAALVQAAQAAVDNAKLNLDFTTVRAPIGGHTGVRLLDAGNLVTASQNNGLVVITQTKPISVLFTLPQQYFLDIRRGITAAGANNALPVEALDDAGRTLASGKLELIDNQIDTSTGTLRLKAVFPNDDQTLWPGQFVNARVLVQTLPQALNIPTEAVQPGLDGPFAYVVKADSTVEPRNLKLGPSVNGITVVQSGLAAGDRVVREGQNKLEPGSRVELAKPTPAPASAASGSANTPAAAK